MTKREKMKINKIRDQKCVITTEYSEIHNITRNYNKKFK